MDGGATNNMINVWVGDQNANVVWSKNVSTGLSGSPQAGFSTGSTLQNQNGVFVLGTSLFVVNPAAASLSMLSISATDPTSVAAVAVASTPTWPVSVAAAKNVVCVLSAGSSSGYGTSQVQCFTFTTSSLTAIGTPTTLNSANAGASQIAFSKDTNALLVSTKAQNYMGTGTSYPPAFQVIPVTWTGSTSIALGTAVGTTAYGALAWPFTEGPSGTVLLADVHPFGNTSMMSNVYYITFTTGSAAMVTTPQAYAVPGQTAVCWMSYSMMAMSWFSGNGGPSFSQFGVTNGMISKTRDLTSPSTGGFIGDMTVVTLSGQDYVFGTHPTDSSLNMVKVSATGASTVTAIPALATASNKMNGMAAYVMTPASASAQTRAAWFLMMVAVLINLSLN